MNAQTISALRKEGKVDEAYQLSKEMLSAGTTDSAVISAFSWVLWQKMKQLSQDSSALPDFIGYLTELAMLNLENTEFNFTLFDTLRTNIAKLATELCRDKEKSPAILSHELDSLFQIFCLMPMRHFNEYRSFFIKSFADKRWSSILDFATWIGWDNLDDTEYQSTRYNGYLIPSAAESLTNAICLQLLNKESPAHSHLPEYLPLLETLAEERGRDFQFIRYYVVQMMLAVGGYSVDQMIHFYTPFIKAKGSNAWVWELLADIYASANDVPLTLASLCKGALQRGDEKFKVSIHTKMASIFAHDRYKRYREASQEIHLILSVYRANGWNKPPREIVQMSQQPWYQEPQGSQGNRALYKQYADYLDEQFRGPKKVFVITDYNPTKKIYVFTATDRERGHFISSQQLKVGGVYQGFYESPKKPGGFVRMEALEALEGTAYPQLVRRISGTLHLHPKGFGFINNDFVSPALVRQEQLVDGQTYDALSVLSYERKKDAFKFAIVRILRD